MTSASGAPRFSHNISPVRITEFVEWITAPVVLKRGDVRQREPQSPVFPSRKH
jgi:hypothetical protein